MYFDAVNDPAAGETVETQVNRFLVAQAIMLALAGVPGIYFHSLFGSRNDRAAALETGINRRINRQKLALAALEAELADAQSVRARVFRRFADLLAFRRAHPAFAPGAPQQVLAAGDRIFAVRRETRDARDRVLCLHNLSGERVPVPATLAGGATTALGAVGSSLGRRARTGLTRPAARENPSLGWPGGFGYPPPMMFILKLLLAVGTGFVMWAL